MIAPSRIPIPLVLALLVVAAPVPARAGVLWEAELAGARVVGSLDTARGGVRLELHGEPALETVAPAGGLRPVEWSRGPRVAGWSTRYVVLERAGRPCGELLASRWLGRELAPLWRALWAELRARGIRALPVGRCGAVPPEVLASAGFPLAVGDGRHYVFATRSLRFGVPVPGGTAMAPEDDGG